MCAFVLSPASCVARRRTVVAGWPERRVVLIMIKPGRGPRWPSTPGKVSEIDVPRQAGTGLRPVSSAQPLQTRSYRNALSCPPKPLLLFTRSRLLPDSSLVSYFVNCWCVSGSDRAAFSQAASSQRLRPLWLQRAGQRRCSPVESSIDR